VGPGTDGIGARATRGPGQVPGVDRDGRAVFQAVSGRHATHQRDAGGDCYGDGDDGGAVPARASTAGQHGAVLSAQRGAGSGRYRPRGGKEGQGDGGSNAAVYQLAEGA
jgi:hypothetical protein